MLNAFYILSTHPTIRVCKLSNCEILSDISNLNKNWLSSRKKFNFAYGEIVFLFAEFNFTDSQYLIKKRWLKTWLNLHKNVSCALLWSLKLINW